MNHVYRIPNSMIPEISQKQFIAILGGCILVLVLTAVSLSPPTQTDAQPVQLGESSPSKTTMSAIHGPISTPQTTSGIQTLYSAQVSDYDYADRTYYVDGRTHRTQSSVIGYIMSSSINTTLDSISLTDGMRIEPRESTIIVTDTTGTQTHINTTKSRPQYYTPETVYTMYKTIPADYSNSIQLTKNFTQRSTTNADSYTYTQDTFTINSSELSTSHIPVVIGGTEIEQISLTDSIHVTVTRSTLNELIAVKVSTSRIIHGDVVTESVEYRYRAYAVTPN